MRPIQTRSEYTIAECAEVHGVGYLTGTNVTVKFTPAPPSTGIVFIRTDLTPPVHIPARLDQVTGTQRRTTLGYLPRCVTMVEHLLAALVGLRIDNCFVELDAIEPPGLDGSARPYVNALQSAGRSIQRGRKTVWAAEESIVVGHRDATLAIHPLQHDELRISYVLDYGMFSPIVMQRHTETITAESFAASLAGSRTYLLESEAYELQRQGVGRRTRVTDLLVFGPHGPIENRLRHADEPARHKILDIVGDLSLIGQDIRGHIVAYRSGHPLNFELAKQIQQRLGGIYGVKQAA